MRNQLLARSRSARSGLPLIYHPIYSVPLPANHPFPMAKFARLEQWLRNSNSADELSFIEPPRATAEQLQRAHCAGYVERFCAGQLSAKELRRIGLPWSQQLADRTVTAVGGTIATVNAALQHGLAGHLAGGTHHAHREFGAGYCIFNDLAVAALEVLAIGAVERLIIVDLDVHQGDGSAEILKDEPRAFTFSMHAAKNFPARKKLSDYDVPLESGLDDAGYLQALAQHLPRALEESAAELVIFDAGIDVHAGDRLGLLNISDDGLRQRERYVINLARDAGLPVAAVIGGGYDRDLEALTRRHAVVHQALLSRWRYEHEADYAPGYELDYESDYEPGPDKEIADA